MVELSVTMCIRALEASSDWFCLYVLGIFDMCVTERRKTNRMSPIESVRM